MTNKISDDKRESLRKKLLKEEEKVLNQLKGVAIVDSGDPGGFRAKLRDDEDLGRSDEDNIQDNANLTNKRATEEILEKRLQDIRKALERIDQDEYGMCEECGEEIPTERLEYNPSASVCVACGSK